jgi:hypothetical protein
MKQKILIVILALILIISGAYLYIKHQNQATAPGNTNTDVTTDFPPDEPGDVPGDPEADPQTPTSDTVAVSTQIPGTSATIDNAYLSKPGFIVIYEANTTGQPGTLVGTSGLLGTGPKQDLEIKATLKPGGKYIAMLRTDNGDKKFSAATDLAVTNKNIPVMVLFSVSQ